MTAPVLSFRTMSLLRPLDHDDQDGRHHDRDHDSLCRLGGLLQTAHGL
jgi:hypothetical protein